MVVGYDGMDPPIQQSLFLTFLGLVKGIPKQFSKFEVIFQLNYQPSEEIQHNFLSNQVIQVKKSLQSQT